MTIEEAIEHLITVKEYYISDRDFTPWGEDYKPLLAEEKQAIDKAVETLEKQIPRKVVRSIYNVHFCPTCQGSVWQNRYESKYCFRCGQALDWSVDEPSKPKGKRMFTDEQIERILWEIEQINKEQREEEND